MESGAKPAGRRTVLDLLHDDAVRDSYDTFKDVMADAMVFHRKHKLRLYAVQAAIRDVGDAGLYVEFGVFKGAGLNLFARELAAHGLSITGFDSLEGLSEDWTGHSFGRKKGAYSVGGTAPQIEPNASLRAGWVQDTLPGYLQEHPGRPLAFANMDFDTYSPTSYALQAVRDRLVPGTVLLFDELYGYTGWRNHEYKALTETLPAQCYRHIGFATEAVAIQITQRPD